MIAINTLVIYVVVALASYITPGADWLIISRYAVESSRKGVVAAVGVQSGLFVHMSIGALGAVSIMSASPKLFSVLQCLGAIYLIYLGISVFREKSTALGDDSNTAIPIRYSTPYRQGLIANILNPKAALFFVSILPQFIRADGNYVLQVIILGLVDIITGLGWWIVFVAFFSIISRKLGSDIFKYYIDRTTGVVLIAVGLAFFAEIYLH
ncbi:LysE family translocator [Acetobacter sicerae]|uniref:LysE family translocator n=1 Tax=Acetobacter sicerae TaxID=85325 RepID=A0ABS8VSG4_9PROT|nr:MULTISPECIES: LysE family translocator [Acetobacter]MBC9009767.1 LysE family translocator [Acetobacter tropicalis]MCE0743873.1 LysE family translocator [Acetobacter sicerae]